MPPRPSDASRDHVSLEIKVAERDLSDRMEIYSVETTAKVGDVSRATVTMALGSNGDLPRGVAIGREISLAAAWGTARKQTIFAGVISCLAFSVDKRQRPTLRISCVDRTVALQGPATSARHADLSTSDILTGIAQKAGLRATVEATPDIATRLRPMTSDWDYMTHLARAQGLIVTSSDDSLRIAPPQSDAAPVLAVEMGQDILALDVEIAANPVLAKARLRGWDAESQSVVSTESSRFDRMRFSNVSSKELAHSIAAQTLDAPRFTADTERLKRETESLMERGQLAAVSGTCRFIGSALPAPDTTLDIRLVGDAFDGVAYVSGVRQELRDGNWTTNVTLGLPLDKAPEDQEDGGLQIGTVISAEDPEGAGRIQIALPLAAPDEDIVVWARNAVPYATDDAGMTFLPEIGDEVVVSFLLGDPDGPVILGALHSPARSSGVGPTGTNSLKRIKTREGLSIKFDEAQKALSLETPGGHAVTLDDETGTLTLSASDGTLIRASGGDLTLSAPGDITLSAGGKLTMIAESDVLLTGTDITADAANDLVVRGAGGAELSSSATTVVKGATVEVD